MIRETRQRIAIRRVFESADGPISPEDVLALAQESVSGLGIATVYRSIKNLVEEGWLVAVELPGQASRYEVAGKGHHHHFHDAVHRRRAGREAPSCLRPRIFHRGATAHRQGH